MTKFNSIHDEYLYEGSVVSGVSQGDGDVAAPTGWFCPISLLATEDTQPEDEEERAALAHYGTRHLILHESNEGFVTVLTFPDETSRNRRVLDLQQAYSLWEAGLHDAEIRLAIDNYLAAAVHTGADGFGDPLEGQGLTWSGAAQVQARDEVIAFVTQSIDEVRAFQRATGHGWEQVGIDFLLTRNGLSAGFWSRGGGAAATTLTEDARNWGPIKVVVGGKGEMEFAS